MKFPKWWYESRLNGIGHPIIDHCIVEKRKDGLIQVHSRPYNFSMDLLWRLMIQCKAFGIDFRISGETTYANEDTLTITFWKFQDEKAIKDWEMFKDVIEHNRQNSNSSSAKAESFNKGYEVNQK